MTVGVYNTLIALVVMAVEKHDMRDVEPTPPKSEFVRMLESQWAQDNFLCIGLDPDYEMIPESFKGRHIPKGEVIYRFNRTIIDATAGLVCAYKPNAAFFEPHERDGAIEGLRRIIAYIHQTVPGIPVIYDAKRADIGNTNKGYAEAAFDDLKADAITVNPYFGQEALKPFLDRADKGIIVLARTSNPGAGELQNIVGPDGDPLYLTVAKKVANEWNTNGNCALVVGATAPDELAQVRAVVGNMPILIPGLGKQGGDVNTTVKSGMDSRGWGMIINSSRDIIFADNPGTKAQKTREAINLARSS